MKINGLLFRAVALMLAIAVLFTVAGCYRIPKQKVAYVTSEYEVEEEIPNEETESEEEEQEESFLPVTSSKPTSSNKDKNSSKKENVGKKEDASKEDSSKNDTTSSGSGNLFLGSGGVTAGGPKVTVENVDRALYTCNPTIEWSKLSEGQKVNIQIKDTAGKVLLDKKGLTGTSYKCETALENGAHYYLKISYTDSNGEEQEIKNFDGEGKKVLCLGKTSAEKIGGEEYNFNGSISLDVLNNYLDRATQYGISSGGIDPAEFDEGARYILNVGAKYVLRAGGEWYASNGPTTFSEVAKRKIAQVHSVDPDIIFEACIFETVTESINHIKIPAWVFEDFGLKPEDRNFKMTSTLFPAIDTNKDGELDTIPGLNAMGLNAHIPDITRIEHQMFVYYRATQYIDMGFEALHLGQVNLIGQNDPNDEVWTKVIGMIREYAKKHARRGYVIINAHGELINSENGAQLVDMIVAPTRIRASEGEVDHEVSEENPQRCDISAGNAPDAVYNKRELKTSPSGWTTDQYPYLVHLDNYDDGVNGDHSNKENIWGWDETSW